MVNIERDLNEILYLNKKVNYHLAMKGGSEKKMDDIFEKYKLQINWTVYITIFLILYYIFKKNISSIIPHELIEIKSNIKKIGLSGGSLIFPSSTESNKLQNDDFFNNILKEDESNISNIFDNNFDINTILNESSIFIKKIVYSLDNDLLSNMNISIQIPGIIRLKVFKFVFGLYFTIIIVCILIMFVIGNIMGHGIYIPCHGCSSGSKVFKCIPGTGVYKIKNKQVESNMCKAYKKTMATWDGFINAINTIAPTIESLVTFIGRAISYIINGVVKLFKVILSVLTYPGKIIEALANMVPYLNVNDDFRINLGELLVGCNSDDSEDQCMYVHKQGVNTYELRRHGNGSFLKEVFKIIKDFLETVPPPKLDWDFFGGNIKSDSISDNNFKNINVVKNETKISKDKYKNYYKQDARNLITVNKPKQPVKKTERTKNFEAFKDYIIDLDYPTVRKVKNPKYNNILDNIDKKKRQEQIKKYQDFLDQIMLLPKSKYNDINLNAKNFKKRVKNYSNLIKKIKSETDKDYQEILKLSNDIFTFSLDLDNDKLTLNEKNIIPTADPESPDASTFTRTETTKEKNDYKVKFEIQQEERIQKQKIEKQKELNIKKQTKKLEDESKKIKVENNRKNFLKLKIQEITKLLGPNNNGVSELCVTKDSTGRLVHDLLIEEYQLKKKDTIKRGDSYYRVQYNIKARNLRNERRAAERELSNINKNIKKAKDKNKHHYLYIHFIKLLIAINFNPIELIVSLVNKFIYIINLVFDTLIVKPLDILIGAVIKVIGGLFRAMIECLNIIVEDIMMPIRKTITKIKVIPITAFKIFNWITNIGPIKFLLYSIYYVVDGVIGDFLPHLAIIIITIIIAIILFVCPMIGFYSAFGYIVSVIYSLIINIIKLIIYTIYSIVGPTIGFSIINTGQKIYNYDYSGTYYKTFFNKSS
tara:strand:+ start:2245 stop:5040 length:2796 start_codon:yes stop_codon:yes gene_type:complete